MTERALDASCRDCGRPLSMHDGDQHAVRCADCFDDFLRARDADFLSSYAELGVTSRRVIAETSLRALVMESPPHRKVLAMHIMEQYVAAASDLVALYHALRQRGRRPIMDAMLHFELDRSSATAFFRDIVETPGPELLASLGIPTPEQVPHFCASLPKRDARDLSRAIEQLLYDLNYTARMGESGALALAQMAGESRGGAALVKQTDWLDDVGLRGEQVASLAVDRARRTVHVTAISVDEKKLENVLGHINAMTRAAQNIIYAVLSMRQEEDRAREAAASGSRGERRER